MSKFVGSFQFLKSVCAVHSVLVNRREVPGDGLQGTVPSSEFIEVVFFTRRQGREGRMCSMSNE